MTVLARLRGWSTLRPRARAPPEAHTSRGSTAVIPDSTARGRADDEDDDFDEDEEDEAVDEGEETEEGSL